MNERYNLQISVVTVSYNAVQTIEETINSVLHQNYTNIEYIIIDGASTDGTLDVLKKYGTAIKWVSEPDNGIYEAMNKALVMASGDFLIFLGADDHFLSNSIIKQVVSYITDLDCLYYGDVYRNSRNDIYKGKFNKYKLSLENICHQSIFYPRHIYKEYRYETEYKVYADYYYNLTIYPFVKFEYIPITVCYYNYEGFSSTARDVEFDRIIDAYVMSQNGVIAYLLRKVYKFYKRHR